MLKSEAIKLIQIAKDNYINGSEDSYDGAIIMVLMSKADLKEPMNEN